jgi:ribonuclease VapC
MAPVLYAIDAQPLVAWLRNEPSFAVVQALVAGTKSGAIELRLTTVNAGEVEYGVERALGAAAGHRALEVMQDIAEIEWVDLELASRAGWLKLRCGMGYADCFVAALAHRDGIPLITGDPDFRRVADLVTIAWLDDFRI